MTEIAAGWGAKSLPRQLRLFPLAGALLLPGGTLPLNIFEPRYLAMTRDALATDRLIGMIQPADPASEAEKPRLYSVGCAGRIVEQSDTEDGRILIELAGVCRFDVVEELSAETPYRQAAVNFDRFSADLAIDQQPEQAGALDRDTLLAALKEYLKHLEIGADWPAIAKAPDERLVNALAMICPFGPNEKQALLEAVDLTERARLMMMMMQMAVSDRGIDYGRGPMN
jgi:Lon protease-like protein